MKTLTVEEIDELARHASCFALPSRQHSASIDPIIDQAKRVPELEDEIARLTGLYEAELGRYEAEVGRLTIERDSFRDQADEWVAAAVEIGIGVTQPRDELRALVEKTKT